MVLALSLSACDNQNAELDKKLEQAEAAAQRAEDAAKRAEAAAARPAPPPPAEPVTDEPAIADEPASEDRGDQAQPAA